MKLSVSLPEKDVEFLDLYITMHDLESRSAALQAALKALRDLDLQEQYEAAWSEEEDPGVLAHWQRKWDDWEKTQGPDASW
jgi:Arc/MetJ-type ribon-helix-helix transcriptional regulator